MTTRRSIIFVLAAGAILATAAACGGSAGGDGGSGPAKERDLDLLAKPGSDDPGDGGFGVATADGAAALDVCRLLTAGEASELAGEILGDPTSDRYASGQSICTFGATAPGSYTFVQLSLFVQTPELSSDGYGAQRVFRDQRDANQPVEDIDGIGDMAYRHANAIEVLAGPVTFGVRIAVADARGTVETPRHRLEDTARIVLARLGQG